MTWRVSGDGGAFLEWDGGTYRADPETDLTLRVALADRTAVYATATGPAYTPTGPDDEFGVYLLARTLIPGSKLVGGIPPYRALLGSTTPKGITP